MVVVVVTPRDPGPELAAAFGLPVQERFVAPGTWNAEEVLDALRDWTSEVGLPPYAYEWCSPSAKGREPRLRGSERWVRDYPRWPGAGTVSRYHGSWKAALLAAGLPGGRQPLELSLGERVEAARRMHSSGISRRLIADELGVSEHTVGVYLRATLCECGRYWRVRGARCIQCAAEANAARVRRWDRPAVIDALQRWARSEGGPPSSEQWLPGRNARERWAREYPAWPPNGTVTRLFGSWNAAIAAAGFAAKPSAYTDQHVIDALQADARQRGRTPRLEEWLDRPAGSPGIGAVNTHFGSWNAGLRAAGLRLTHRQGYWTRQRLITALQRDARRRGRAPARDEWARSAHGRPSWSTVASVFGSWNEGLRAARLPLNGERDKWTPVSVLDALRRLERELGRQPTSQDLVRPPAGYPNTAIIARKLGSWSAACSKLDWKARHLGSQRGRRQDQEGRAALPEALPRAPLLPPALRAATTRGTTYQRRAGPRASPGPRRLGGRRLGGRRLGGRRVARYVALGSADRDPRTSSPEAADPAHQRRTEPDDLYRLATRDSITASLPAGADGPQPAEIPAAHPSAPAAAR